MEAGEIGSRQSGTTTADNAPDRYEHHEQHSPFPPHHQQQQQQQAAAPQRPRESVERPYLEGPPPAMAAATLMTSAPYPGHPHSFTPGYPHSSAGPPPPGMISPIEPRRRSDDTDTRPQQRQSLPSISEVISSTRSSEYAQPPGPATGPMGGPPPPSNYSSPYVSSRPYPEPPVEKGPSPRPAQSSYPPGQQPLPAPFAESPRARQFGGGRPGPPPIVGPYSAPHPSPPLKDGPMRPDSDKPPESVAMNGAYPSHPPGPMSIAYASHGQLPPGQLPLAAGYPVSPRHVGPPPPLPSPYESQRTPRPEDEPPRRFEMTVHRNLDTWNYSECLSRVASSSRTIFSFAEGYQRTLGEQATPRPIMERLPAEREISEMLNNVDYIKRSLEQLREHVQQNIRHEQMQGKMKGYDEEDVQMYGNDKPATFGVLTEVKKRRGRAAPPGRCHSCNRIDTPEWRRGPDGARTLCNACGLHYAKLERKRLLESRSLRPKGSDEQN